MEKNWSIERDLKGEKKKIVRGTAEVVTSWYLR